MMVQPPGYATVPIPAPVLTPQVVMPAQPLVNANGPKGREKNKLNLYKLGILEVVLGCFIVILAVVTIVLIAPYHFYGADMTYSAPGLWCGASLIASGILGIKAKSHPTVCIYRANMTMSTIAACLMAILVVMSGITASISRSMTGGPIHAIIGAVGGIGAVVSIIHFACCCAGVCDHGVRAYQGTVMYLPQQQYLQLPHEMVWQPQQIMQSHPQQLMVQLANGQFMFLENQFMLSPSYPTTAMPVRVPPRYHPPASLSQQQQFLQLSASNNTEPVRMNQETTESPPAYSDHPGCEA